MNHIDINNTLIKGEGVILECKRAKPEPPRLFNSLIVAYI